jgi:hypothetical protein
MSETVLERHYRDRMQSVRQIAEHEAGHAMLARSAFHDIVALCFELSHSGRELLELEYKRIFKEPNLTAAWLQERRQVVEELSNKFLEMVATLKEMAGRAASPSAETDIVARLDQAALGIVEARRNVLERWPVGNAQEIAEARAGGSSRDYVDADEAFARIAGMDVEAWRKRVDKHKQACHD